MGRIYEASITMGEEQYKLYEKVSAKLGFRNFGHTIEYAIRLLNEVIETQERGFEMGMEKDGTFYPWIFSRVKLVEKSDEFLGKEIKCERCEKEFKLVEGTVYRESPEHEGVRSVECLHCSWINDF